MIRRKKKTFVLDTNVILHDSTCIHRFQEHDVVVPMPVLEELDQFKKGNESLNFHAREFVRSLDALSTDSMFGEGVPIGTGMGRISIRLEREFHPDLGFSLSTQKSDNQILNISYHLARENPKQEVILVSKDVNLRMKAKSIGLAAEDYTTDHVKDVSRLYTGCRIVEGVSSELLDQLYAEGAGVPVEDVPGADDMLPNEYAILRNGKTSALATLSGAAGVIHRIDKVNAYGITPRNAGQTFALNALLNPDIQLVTISGKAGTGKTLLALAAALERRRQYLQIYMARPVVPLSNKDLGYLPGDIHSKLEPYMQPLYDNLGVIRLSESEGKANRVNKLLEEEKLVIAPLAYIRGRSLVRIFFIVDEAQNLTPHEVKTIITRAGEGTKIVFTGDVFQIDHPYLDSHSNGLSYLIEKMQGQKLYAHINLEKGERSELAELASNLL